MEKGIFDITGAGMPSLNNEAKQEREESAPSVLF